MDDTDPAPVPEPKALTPAARRALAEASARRAEIDAKAAAGDKKAEAKPEAKAEKKK